MAVAVYNCFADPLKRDDFYRHVVNHVQKDDIDLLESFNMLENTLEQRCVDWPNTKAICPLLVSIDEVHVLYTRRSVDIGSSYTLYSCLKSVLNRAIKRNFAVISLTTATHVPSLAPANDLAASIREGDHERDLPAPFTELPFDVHVIKEPLTPGCANLITVGSLKFTAKFGRPL